MRLSGRLINYFCMMVIGFLLGAVFVGYLLGDSSHFWTLFSCILLMVALVVMGEVIGNPRRQDNSKSVTSSRAKTTTTFRIIRKQEDDLE